MHQRCLAHVPSGLYKIKRVQKMPKQAIQHVLIPKHKKVSDKEKKDILDKYKITVNELPSISKKDPALAGMDVEAGDVIRIERRSPTAGDTVFYRGVVDE